MFSSRKIADARRRMRHRRSTLNGGSACQVITHALVNVGRYTPARSSRRHVPASTCSVSSRTIAAPRNRAGSVWCSNGTRSLPRQWSSRYARLMRHSRAGSRTIGSRTTTRDGGGVNDPSSGLLWTEIVRPSRNLVGSSA
jgi:hypothetical protein